MLSDPYRRKSLCAYMLVDDPLCDMTIFTSLKLFEPTNALNSSAIVDGPTVTSATGACHNQHGKFDENTLLQFL